MGYFDVSKNWIVLIVKKELSDQGASRDLVRCIGELRRTANLNPSEPPFMDGAQEAPDESTPLILLNSDSEDPYRNGFSWRAGDQRIEIYGNSDRALEKGIYDFLGALGFRWPDVQAERGPPRPEADARYPLSKDGNHVGAASNLGTLGRMFFNLEDLGKRGAAWIHWAARNQFDSLVVTAENAKASAVKLRNFLFQYDRRFAEAIESHRFPIEIGGVFLSSLVPRSLFFRSPDLFRMVQGRRRNDRNFCPTNPGTLKIVRENAKKLFAEYPEVRIFHLWADGALERDAYGSWCSCPACRAFSPDEQALMGLNIAADTLKEGRNDAWLSYIAPENGIGTVKPRPNTFPVQPRDKLWYFITPLPAVPPGPS